MIYFNSEFTDNLMSEFPDISLEYREIELGGVVPAFFIFMNNEEHLRNHWGKITEYIAIYFQSMLKNEYSIWNIYLFFLLQDEVSNEIKYQIENDTFSSRKIVISPIIDIDTIIRENIINDDWNVHDIEESNLIFTPNEIIWKALGDMGSWKKKTISHTESLKQIIKQLKKKSS